MKHKPDVGWDDRLKGYRCRVLIQRTPEGTHWEAWARDLEGVQHGFSTSKDEAMDIIKANLAKKLQSLKDDNGGRIPWVPISFSTTLGARDVWVFIRLIEPEKLDATN